VAEAAEASATARHQGTQNQVIAVRSTRLDHAQEAWLEERLANATRIVTVHDSYGGYLRHWVLTHLKGNGCDGRKVRSLDVAGFGSCGEYSELLKTHGLDAGSILSAMAEV
jgi:transketolase C-terminal domain/subunit